TEPPSGAHFLQEIKFDGYRALGRIDHSAAQPVILYTRNGNDWTTKFRSIAEALGDLPVESAYLDGEIVVLGEKGQSDFQALQNALHARENAPLVYFVFDLLFLNGHDLRGQPLVKRKELLQALLKRSRHERIRYSDHIE